MLLKEIDEWIVLAYLMAVLKKQTLCRVPFSARKKISETAFPARSLCSSIDSITGQPQCLTSLFMFGTHAAFLQSRQVPEALPLWSLLSESIR